MLKNLEIKHFETEKEAAFVAAKELESFLIEHKSVPILVLFSGGSALEIPNNLNPDILQDNQIFTMLDERFSEDKEVNNFLQLQKTHFYEAALQKDCSFYGSLPRPGENLENFSKRIENRLREWKSTSPKGKIIAIFGMGSDGHTAGIFPEPDTQKFEQLFNSENWVIGYQANTKYQQRTTTTLSFFKNIDRALIYVCGNEKKEMLKNVIHSATQINQAPALAWKNLKSATIFTNININ